jgi:hypothetical protein
VEWQITCPRCGFSGLGRRVLPGSDRREKLLWYLLVLPGAGYHLWRLMNARTGCARCDWDGTRPTDAP